MEEILLINPPDRGEEKVDKDKAGGLGTLNYYPIAPNPPLDILQIAAILEEKNYRVNILEAVIEDMDIHSAVDSVRNTKAYAIGIRLSLPSLSEDLIFVNEIKRRYPDRFVFLFGPVVRYTYSQWVEKTIADRVVFGEGDKVIPEMLLSPEKEDIPGIIFKKDGSFVVTSDWQYLEDLDTLPPPAWHLIPLEKYQRDGDISRFTFFVQTSRGCPYACSMCPYFAVQGRKWRARNVAKVIDELMYIRRRFGARILQFRDASFEIDIKRAEEIWERIAREDMEFEITVELNLEYLNNSIIQKMAQAGVKVIMTGVESPEKIDLIEIGCTSNHFQKIKDNISLCHKMGVKVFGFFIIGFSNDSWSKIEMTIHKARELELDLYYFAVMTPYHGTRLYERVRKEGRLRPSISYRDFGSHTSILRTRYMDFEELDFAHIYAAKALAVFRERREFFKNCHSITWLRSYIKGEIILVYLKIKCMWMRFKKRYIR